MDLTKQLQAYEVEYQVLNDELHAPSDFSQHQRAAHLERLYQSLQKQNSQLQEELQVQAHTSSQARQRDLVLCSGWLKEFHSLLRCLKFVSPAWRNKWRVWSSLRAC